LAVTVDPIKTQPSATQAAFGYVQIEKIINHDQTAPVPDEEQPLEPER
jgi:hypothetical protein